MSDVMQERDALGTMATPPRLAVLGQAGVLGREGLERAYALSVATPPVEVWRRLLSRLLLVLGALLTVAGVVFFFAFNWAHLPSWAKLSLLQVGVVASALVALRPASGLVVRQVALLGSALLVGPLLGVYGQTYQTGADPWGLFALWAALIVPWVLAARTPALWLVEVVLIDTAVGLWFGQVFAGNERETWGALAVSGVNAAAWLGWEMRAARGAPWARGRWWPRLMAASVMLVLLVPAVMALLGIEEGAVRVGLGAELVVVGLGLVVFRRRDLFVAAVAIASVIAMVTSLAGHVLFEKLEGGSGSVLLLGFLVVVQVGMAVSWLRSNVRGEEA